MGEEDLSTRFVTGTATKTRLMLTTRVIPDETTSPTPARTATISESKTISVPLPCTHMVLVLASPEHAFVDVWMTLNAIDAEEKKWNHHQETEYHPDVLYHVGQICTNIDRDFD
jgi:hypothetical protein